MKKLFLGLLFLTGLAVLNTGCYAHVNGAGAGMEIGDQHDKRWHYDHDYDDSWRARHPWDHDHWD